jgi:hypothetical protein
MWWQSLHPIAVAAIMLGTVPAIMLVAMLIKGEW